MRKNIITIAFMAAAFLAVSCQKENNPESDAPNQDAPQFTASIESSGNTKTTVEREAGTTVTYKTKWESTDCIKINGATYQATPDGTDETKATFTYKSGDTPSGTYKAYFPASIYEGSTATLPATYTYEEGKYNMPMYAESSTISLSFKNLCGILAITVQSTEMTKVKSITVTSDKRMNGAFTATSDGVLTFASSAATDADKKVTLSFTNAKTIESSVTFYIPVPADAHNPLTINVSDGTLMKTMVTKKSGGVSISRNVVYPITFADNQPSILPGLFSVSATKQVQFTSGNLYWNGSAFKLETSQTDYDKGSYNESAKETTYISSHVSHFFWTNLTDYKSGRAEYMPYASSYQYGNGNNDDKRTTSDKFWYGEDNELAVDGQSGLYALSNGEWYYLITSRTNAGSLRSFGVTVSNGDVNYYNCLIIAPDGYSGTALSQISDWSLSNVNKLGLVCLPAAGDRNPTTLNDANLKGYYWTASPDSTEVSKAWELNFNSSGFSLAGGGRSHGCSVRLVSTVSQ